MRRKGSLGTRPDLKDEAAGEATELVREILARAYHFVVGFALARDPRQGRGHNNPPP
jgi:hypothetical protein